MMTMHNAPEKQSGKQSGFTLVELMIAMVLGLIVAGGVVSIFVKGQQSYRMDGQVARMHDEARFALSELARDIRMASYISEVLVPTTVTLDGGLAIATDCGPAAQVNWMYRLTDAVTGEVNTLTGVDNATGALANASYSCVNAGEIRLNTDIVAVKRASGGTTTFANLQAGETYIRSNGTIARLFTQPAAAAIPPPFTDRVYRPRIYYIRNFSDTAGDGLPSLCRKVLTVAAVPTMATECIGRGIEDLQIEYGLDTDGNGTPNRYLANPTLTEMQQAVTVRIYLLARTQDRDIKYTDPRTYQFSNMPAYTPADNFHRRLYSITVGVYNRRNLRQLLGV